MGGQFSTITPLSFPSALLVRAVILSALVLLTNQAKAGTLEGARDAVSTKGISQSHEEELAKLVSERVNQALQNPPFAVRASANLPPELVNLISGALLTNPMLKVKRSQIAIYEQRVAPAGAKMEPMLGIEFMNRMVTRPFSYMDTNLMDTIRFRQEFMSYGKRITMKNMAEKDVELKRWELANEEYTLIGEILNMYYDLLELTLELDQVQKNRELLGALADIVRARYELNQVMQSDLLMVQMRYSQTYERESMLLEMKQAMLARLSGMVGIPVEDLTVDFSLNGEELSIPTDLTPLLEEAIARHPKNFWLTTKLDQVELMKKLAKKEYFPNYALEVSYGYRQMYPDMFSAGFMINLPIYKSQKQDAKIMEAEAMKAEVQFMREELFNDIRAKVSEQVAKIKELKERLRLYEGVLLPQARATFDSALASYQVNMDQFAVLIESALAVIEMETMYRVATANLARAYAQLDYLTLGAISDRLEDAEGAADKPNSGENDASNRLSKTPGASIQDNEINSKTIAIQDQSSGDKADSAVLPEAMRESPQTTPRKAFPEQDKSSESLANFTFKGGKISYGGN